MPKFYKLKRNRTNYTIYKNKMIPFAGSQLVVSDESIKKSFDFAYEMTFGLNGEHRAYRSGGQFSRRNGEIFANAFQGKLSEFAFFEMCRQSSLDLQMPDVATYMLGDWDSYDFTYKNKKIAIKSTKHYGQLLLLETKDWNNEGAYIPNLEKTTSVYDYFVLVRSKPSVDNVLKSKRLLYSDELDKEILWSIIKEENWLFDLPGYITIDELRYLINERFILPQNSTLNENTQMDAENYYAKVYDMSSMSDLITELMSL